MTSDRELLEEHGLADEKGASHKPSPPMPFLQGFLQWPDGSGEDPSLILGMGGKARAADRAEEIRKNKERFGNYITAAQHLIEAEGWTKPLKTPDMATIGNIQMGMTNPRIAALECEGLPVTSDAILFTIKLDRKTKAQKPLTFKQRDRLLRDIRLFRETGEWPTE